MNITEARTERIIAYLREHAQSDPWRRTTTTIAHYTGLQHKTCYRLLRLLEERDTVWNYVSVLRVFG